MHLDRYYQAACGDPVTVRRQALPNHSNEHNTTNPTVKRILLHFLFTLLPFLPNIVAGDFGKLYSI